MLTMPWPARTKPEYNHLFSLHSFLQDHPVLLEEGHLSVNWDRIPGLYSRTDKLLTVSISDAQWEKWGRPGGWTAWEPDTRAGNFIPNMVVVVCKGIFNGAPEPQLQNKVSHFMTIARVPDCVELLRLTSFVRPSTTITKWPLPSGLCGYTVPTWSFQMFTFNFTTNTSL